MKIVPFGEVCTLEYGKPLDKEFRKSDGDYLAYGANGPISSASKYLIEGPSIIVGRKGSAGEITLVESNVWPLDVTYYIKHNPNETDLRYLFYALKSLNIKQFVRGVKPGLNRNDVYELSIPLPSPEKQLEIVEKLDSAFAEIDSLEVSMDLTNQKVSQFLESVLSSSLTKSDIDSKQNRELTDHMLPVTWHEVSLKQICDVDWGNTKLTKSSYVADGDFLAVSAAGADGLINHYEHEANVPVLSAIGAQCGRMFYPGKRFTAIKNTITLTPKEDMADGKFLYYLFTHVELPQRGTGQPFISKGDIESFRVSIPESIEEQLKIVEKLDKAFAGVEKMRNQIAIKKDLATMLRQSILNEALSQSDELVTA